MDSQLAAELVDHTTCLGFTHLLALTPCDTMWLAHGGVLHPDWPVNPQPAAHVLSTCLSTACYCMLSAIWMVMLELFCVMTSLQLLTNDLWHLLVIVFWCLLESSGNFTHIL